MSQEIQTTYGVKQSEVSKKSNNTDDLDWIVGSKISNYTPNCNNKKMISDIVNSVIYGPKERKNRKRMCRVRNALIRLSLSLEIIQKNYYRGKIELKVTQI